MSKVIVKAKKQRAILPEGRYQAKVSSVEGKPGEDPKKIRIGFKVKDHERELFKEHPATLNPGSPLLMDIQRILQREFKQSEIDAGLDLAMLIGHDAEIIVAHKSSSGGRPGEIVSSILPAATPPTPGSTGTVAPTAPGA